MTTPRLNTVFDHASLRLHQSGERLVRVNQSASNLNLRTSRSTVQDRRGNWIARDAGGSQNVYKSLRVNPENDEDGENEVINLDIDTQRRPEAVEEPGKSDLGVDDDWSPGRRRAKARVNDQESTGHDSRYVPRKRRKLNQDLDFLDATLPSSQVSHGTGLNDSDSGSSLPIPSSDLLKCIHHFASNYYDERGQLLNLTREYRRERKQRRLAKLQAQKSATAKDASDESEGEEGGVEVELGVEENDPEHQAGRKKKVADGAEKLLRRDMYKVMDGSALMAIGMLLQEHIAHLLTPRIPDGWEESLLQVEEDDTDTDEDAETSHPGSEALEANSDSSIPLGVPPSTDASQLDDQSTRSSIDTDNDDERDDVHSDQDSAEDSYDEDSPMDDDADG